MKGKSVLAGALLAGSVWASVHIASVMAACDGCTLQSPNDLGIPALEISSVAKNIIGTLSFVAAVLSVFFIVVAGIRYASSSGNQQRIEGAKQQLTYAVIGLIISVLAVFIVGFILTSAP